MMKPAVSSSVLALAVCALVACEKKSAPPAPVAVSASASPVAAAPAHSTKVEFPEVPIRAAESTKVHVAWKTPAGTSVNEEAPFRVRWNRSDALAEAPADVKATGTSARDGFDITVKPLAGAPNATLGGTIDIVVCDAVNHSVCLPVRRAVEIEFVVGKAAAAETTVTIPLPEARTGG
ncbi:hypothetical protein BH11MYX4_BH11MYX4_30720 [soil metagenome]